MKRILTVFLLLALALPMLPAKPALAATFTVTNTNDSGAGSLRWAIEQANTNPGPDVIHFNIPGGGVHTIAPLTPLPLLSGGGTLLDGYSQPGAEYADTAGPALLLIEIVGTNIATASSGLNITSPDNTVRGLVINRFSVDGISIGFAGASGNVITGNYLGCDPNGMIDRGNARNGVLIGLGATQNIVGGDQPAERNVLSGNAWAGAEIHGSGTMSNTLSGNYIGTSASGMAALGNTLYGVRIYGGAQNNLVGGETAGERNIISGNGIQGITVAGLGTSGNLVVGNYIGTTALGTAALGNFKNGVLIANGAQGNTIGGDTFDERNVISGNLGNGIAITGTNTMSNTVTRNYIGVDTGGNTALANELDGVYLYGGAQHNRIGGDADTARNIISGNGSNGIQIAGENTNGNIVSGNRIGTSQAGSAAVPNAENGISINSGAQGNLIGGDGGDLTLARERNVISANLSNGIFITGTNTLSNTIAGNYIGTSADGRADLGNGNSGILLVNAVNTLIGGTQPERRNLISGNRWGIALSASQAAGNLIAGNWIGTDASGMADLGNEYEGINIDRGVHETTIGPGNVIAGNDRMGIFLGLNVSATRIVGNRIGTGATGVTALGNYDGILVQQGYQNVIGGTTPEERNLISGNSRNGIYLREVTTTGNLVSGNYIGTDANGTAALGNSFGIYFSHGAQDNLIGGMAPAARNIISGNHQAGISLSDSDTMSNTIAGNSIGTDAGGLLDLGNGSNGVVFDAGTHHNTLGPGNQIAYHDASGVRVDDPLTLMNGITQNGIYANTGPGIELSAGAHGNIPAPTLISDALVAGTLIVQGTACPGCVVELFANDGADAEGQFYLGQVMADAAGNFSLAVSIPAERYLTATGTDPRRGTSQFSAVYEAIFSYEIYLPLVIR